MSQPDGLPVASAAGQTVSITTTVTAEYPRESTTPYAYYQPRTMNFKLQPKTVTLPDNGLVPLQLNIPSNATNINVHVSIQSPLSPRLRFSLPFILSVVLW